MQEVFLKHLKALNKIQDYISEPSSNQDGTQAMFSLTNYDNDSFANHGYHDEF